jgi:hypothetical protein
MPASASRSRASFRDGQSPQLLLPQSASLHAHSSGVLAELHALHDGR